MYPGDSGPLGTPDEPSTEDKTHAIVIWSSPDDEGSRSAASIIYNDYVNADIPTDMPYSSILPPIEIDLTGKVFGDDLMILGTGDYAVGMGSGAGFEINIILQGDYAGHAYLYTNDDTNFGLGIGVGIMAGFINFNYDNDGAKLTPETFSGWSQGRSVGYLDYSAQTVTGYTDGSWHFPGFGTESYSGTIYGFAKGSVNGYYYYSNSTLQHEIW